MLLSLRRGTTVTLLDQRSLLIRDSVAIRLITQFCLEQTN